MWMKSLVFNGNGCAIFDSDGRIAYRVDNYASQCSDEVYLMDHDGRTLSKILRKKLRVRSQWEGYRCDGSIGEGQELCWFRARKAGRILRGEKNFEAKVTVGSGSSYKILGSACKGEYKILDVGGEAVAEVKRKHTSCGVALGEDVLTLMIEPNHDQLLIMSLAIVCGLINHSM
ncbi:protein LURP-one-related 11-like isoform X2 [Asparagus officinalis]|nr:protein LURP-one-related 11-like isoform X2 [Asparagus officinalis]